MDDEKAHTLRIMVVDDEEEICRIFLKFLSSGGYEAEAATSEDGCADGGEKVFLNIRRKTLISGIARNITSRRQVEERH